jgi:hypothetical protein
MKSDKSRQVKFNFFELNARISKIYLVYLSISNHIKFDNFLSFALVLVSRSVTAIANFELSQSDLIIF